MWQPLFPDPIPGDAALPLACSRLRTYTDVVLAWRDQRYLAYSPGAPYLVFLCCFCEKWHLGQQGPQPRRGQP